MLWSSGMNSIFEGVFFSFLTALLTCLENLL